MSYCLRSLPGLLALVLLVACGGAPSEPTATSTPATEQATARPTTAATSPQGSPAAASATAATQPPADDAPLADVVSVEVSGEPGNYTFSVGISSPDTGCEQYADWWEVVSEDGELLHRRILLHSHTDEQPFVRSGGPVPIEPDTVVWVRAHMNNGGYGGQAWRGSVQEGFAQAEHAPDFAADLANEPPLPDGCAF